VAVSDVVVPAIEFMSIVKLYVLPIDKIELLSGVVIVSAKTLETDKLLIRMKQRITAKDIIIGFVTLCFISFLIVCFIKALLKTERGLS
jgi:hypothetical protein